MSDNYTIEFTRSKEEMRKIFIGKEYKKTFWSLIIRVVLLAPVSFILAILFTAALQITVDFRSSDSISYLISAVFCIIILIPFIKPVFLMHRAVIKQLNNAYNTNQFITVSCNLDESGIRYKNDHFEFATDWQNINALIIDTAKIQFQAITPNVMFTLPKDKVSPEALELIRCKIGSK